MMHTREALKYARERLKVDALTSPGLEAKTREAIAVIQEILDQKGAASDDALADADGDSRLTDEMDLAIYG